MIMGTSLHRYRRAVAHGFVALIAAALLAASCSSPERANPFDPASSGSPGETSLQTLTLDIPLPKSLATVIDSMVAKLVGPDMLEIVKELTHTPLGPASLTIGAIAPGTDFTLTIEGYDLQGRLIMVGEQRNLTIAVGDTTRVTINLVLTDEFVPEEIVTGGGDEGAGGDESGDGGAAGNGSTAEGGEAVAGEAGDGTGDGT